MSRNKLFSAFSPVFRASYGCIGGQAVMGGVLMRNGSVYGLAVRLGSGEICAQRLPWQSCLAHRFLRLPFLRGFPILIETLANGISALNRSAALAEGGERAPAPLLSLAIALCMAMGLFVIAPHLLSMAMLALRLGGDADGPSFHIWDGFFKAAIFIAYIALISRIPDIRRVFQYHGAEHKAIHAFEECADISAATASGMSRLHPRCGTTFILFVIALSILIQAILVPLFLRLWAPEGAAARHMAIIAFKFALVIPVSAAAFEIIRFSAMLPDGPCAAILRTPGLLLQRLTTREPSPQQVEVALVALAVALGYEEAGDIQVPDYVRLENGAATFDTF